MISRRTHRQPASPLQAPFPTPAGSAARSSVAGCDLPSPSSQRPHLSLPGVACVALVVFLAACATRPVSDRLGGQHHCESFFIYSVCVADEDEDGSVDYMYFGDDLQVFMFDDTQEASLRADHLFHPCAIPMGDSTRSLSSQLLYDDDLGFTRRLELKGALIRNYRAAQPAVEACNAAAGNGGPVPLEDPFDVGEDWEEGSS